MTDETVHCPNIGERGARLRRRNGIIAAFAGVAAGIYMITADFAPGSLGILILPFTFAALGFMQARERTCVALAALGQRDTDFPSIELPAEQLRTVRWQAFRVAIWSLAFGIAFTVLFITAAALDPPG